MNDEIALRRIARGCWQREKLDEMLSPQGCSAPNRELRGKARRYSARYRASFHNMLDRLERNQVNVERVPGPRKGEWGARYFIQGANR